MKKFQIIFALFLGLLTFNAWALSTPINIVGTQYNGRPISVTLSLADVKALPQSGFFTQLPWVEGGAKFTGVELGMLLAHYNIKPGNITLTALNDYATQIDWQDITDYHPIIAIQKNNKDLKIRNYGPYWLIYPTDKFPELKSAEYASKMIWQIKEIRVE